MKMQYYLFSRKLTRSVRPEGELGERLEGLRIGAYTS
jgi:hypothetical protein